MSHWRLPAHSGGLQRGTGLAALVDAEVFR